MTLSLLLNNQPVNSAEKEVRLFSGRHYNTDKEVYQKFQEQTGIKVRYIETDGKAIIEFETCSAYWYFFFELYEFL